MPKATEYKATDTKSTTFTFDGGKVRVSSLVVVEGNDGSVSHQQVSAYLSDFPQGTLTGVTSEELLTALTEASGYLIQADGLAPTGAVVSAADLKAQKEAERAAKEAAALEEPK